MAHYDGYGSSPRAWGASCLGFVVLVALIAAGMAAIWLLWPGGHGTGGEGLDPKAAPRPIAARGTLSDLEKANIEIYEDALPSVVSVTNLRVQREFFWMDEQEVPKGVGSGFIWDEDGHIVTNYHVVQGAQAARVTLSDQAKTQLAAKDVWAYPDKDIAVLWVDVPKGKKLKPLKVGTSHDLKVGQIVYALGDPFELDNTMTFGIVSALGRQIKSVTGQPIPGMIQTTATLNPGNSGGPLLDSAGRLVGMNTAILSPTGGSVGIGFAIPVDEINRVVPQLIKHGKVVQPYLGVKIAADQLARRLGVSEGALIQNVEPGSPAAKAGLRGTSRGANQRIQLGDVILAIDGKAVESGKDLNQVLARHQPGDEVRLTIERNEERTEVRVTLEAKGQKE